MTADEFNEKYSKYLEPGHYGMDIHYSGVIDYLDREFEEETKTNPEFLYSQIKLKFFSARVYTNSQKSNKWEKEIDKMLKEVLDSQRIVDMSSLYDEVDRVSMKNLNETSQNSTIKVVG